MINKLNTRRSTQDLDSLVIIARFWFLIGRNFRTGALEYHAPTAVEFLISEDYSSSLDPGYIDGNFLFEILFSIYSGF